ncbi:MAG: NADH-quinone oxidoreductase subunit C [bacterium]|nr:NADH-quinone oxidoreductase subunit C [bacterium]
MTNIDSKLREFINDQFGDDLLRIEDFRGDISYHIKPAALVEICQALFDDETIDAKYLADITSVDWYGHEDASAGRFEVIYNFYLLLHNYRFFIKVRLEESDPKIASLTPIYATANWLEREVYDLMGIEFEGHPDLTKILTPDDLEGFPLRRDFPLTYEVPHFSFNKDDPPEVIK